MSSAPTSVGPVAIVAFDDFTDIDVFLPWDLLNRASAPGWSVRILADSDHIVSRAGLRIPTHGRIEEARFARAVIVSSGPGARLKARDPDWLARLVIDSSTQLVGSMCSGSLILAALGHLDGRDATTYPTARGELEALGVRVVEKSFVLARQTSSGGLATAAGCLAAQELCGWILERTQGAAVRDRVLRSVQPVGRGLAFSDADDAARIYASPKSV